MPKHNQAENTAQENDQFSSQPDQPQKPRMKY